MKPRQDGFVMAEVIVAFAVLVLALTLFAGAMGASLGATQRRRARQEQLQADLTAYYAAVPGPAEPVTLTLTGPDFSAQVPAEMERWEGEEVTLYTFRPAEAAP